MWTVSFNRAVVGLSRGREQKEAEKSLKMRQRKDKQEETLEGEEEVKAENNNVKKEKKT